MVLRSSRGLARRLALVLAGACGLASARTVNAADPGPQDADALFREGKRLLNERDYARACPLLEASFKADPGTGVLLALAICREGEDKLASALAGYDEVARRAAAEGRPDRAKVARQRGAAIEPNLSTLAISPPPLASRGKGFTISRNGVVVDTEAPVPLDGGTYAIEAKAAGKRTWTATVELASARDRRVVTIPALEDEPVARQATDAHAAIPGEPVRAVATVPRSIATDGPARSTDGHSGLVVASVALGAASLAGLSVTGYYTWRAKEKNEAAKAGCDGDLCDAPGYANRLAALSAGDVATIAFVAATVTAAAAVTLWVIDRKTRAGRIDQAATIRGGLAFDPARAGVMFGLSFSR